MRGRGKSPPPSADAKRQRKKRIYSSATVPTREVGDSSPMPIASGSAWLCLCQQGQFYCSAQVRYRTCSPECSSQLEEGPAPPVLFILGMTFLPASGDKVCGERHEGDISPLPMSPHDRQVVGSPQLCSCSGGTHLRVHQQIFRAVRQSTRPALRSAATSEGLDQVCAAVFSQPLVVAGAMDINMVASGQYTQVFPWQKPRPGCHHGCKHMVASRPPT